jgi:hypothetical protein
VAHYRASGIHGLVVCGLPVKRQPHEEQLGGAVKTVMFPEVPDYR